MSYPTPPFPQPGDKVEFIDTVSGRTFIGEVKWDGVDEDGVEKWVIVEDDSGA